MHAYCHELKLLSDQLANVDAPVTVTDLVLQLITSLNEQYEGIAMVLQHDEPLPSFYRACSSVIQEETRKNHCAAVTAKAADTAFHASTGRTDKNPPMDYGKSEYGRSKNMAGRGRGHSRGHCRQGWG
ncbi:uncharacterized protein LOC143601855 [Bidens hawaiensis]|uniref:uncharacterized protein LOC143601855 n=1 Tax=Bidens hawaiensis TaxID=980011 RepID=UPI00404A8D09